MTDLSKMLDKFAGIDDEQVDHLVSDSLHLVILMQRNFMNFAEVAGGIGKQLVGNCLDELLEIEEGLGDADLMDIDQELGFGSLENMLENAEMVQGVLELAVGDGAIPGFAKLNGKVYVWVGELIENLGKLMEMRDGHVEMVEKDVDSINPEEIHPDYEY